MTLDDILARGNQPEVLGSGYGFTEGPGADGRGNIYFSDGRNNAIHYYEVGQPVKLFVNDSIDPIGMMFNTRGELYVCEGGAYRVVAFDVQTRQKRVLCGQIDGSHFNEPNDLAVDHQDGFYFSDPNYQHHAQPTVMKEDVYYCSPAGEVSRVSTVCFKPNGVLLSGDGKTLYVADARGQRIYKYDVLAPGRLAHETLWIDQLRANPDGLTLDEQGNLYICCGRAGLRIYDCRGEFVGLIPVHAANACFGGPEFRTLFVASADKFLGILTKVTGIKPLPLNPQRSGQPSARQR